MTSGEMSVTRPWWRRPVGIEAIAVTAAILFVPVIGRILYPAVYGPLRALGLTQVLDAFSGSGQFTDVGWEVASARGLLDRGHSMYDSIDVLGRLVGMTGAYDLGSHTHPPTSGPMWIPLSFLPYNWWLPAYVVAAIVAVALSMRVLGVPAWVAYPLAVLVALTSPGSFAMSTTYPMMALVLALAWRFRDRPWIAGLSYAVFASSRGVGALMLLYPLAKRQWRTLAVGIGGIIATLAVAVMLEPDVVSAFFKQGSESISDFSSWPTMYSPQAVLARHGWPGWVWWAAALAVVAVGLVRKRELFWLLAWLVLALTPLGWAHSLVQGVPILVVMWQANRLGRMLVLTFGVLSLAVVTTAPVGSNMAWPIGLVIMGIGVIALPLGREPDSIPQRHTAAAL